MNVKYNFLQYDIDLDLKTKLTVIGGDSGTDKTYLAETIKAIQEQPCIESQAFIINSHSDLVSLASHTEKVVIIDRMEQYTTSEEILKCITSNPDKWFVLFMRGDSRIPFGLRNFADLSVRITEGIFRFRLNYLAG